MASFPLNELELRCNSLAEHLGFVALGDVATAMSGEDGRVIGGHMITLHVFRWGLDLFRVTQDADLGVRPAVVQTPDLTERLVDLGYQRTAGNRFEKPVDGLPAFGPAESHWSAIDILIPAYTSRIRENRSFGRHLVTTEVPGLAAAFQRPAVDLSLDVEFLDGSRVDIAVRLPDEVSALVLKVMARTVRDEDRDAVDVWRALEVCAAAGVRDAEFGPDSETVRHVLADQFGRGGKGIKDVARAQNLSHEAAVALETRIQALISRVAGN
ncbi:MAG: hypothetical protein GY720_02665 [bacterium]|nr:hypothetical protein [bacterium]